MIDKILKNSANIAAIEWPQVVVRLIPTDAWHLKFIITGKNQRTVKIQRMKIKLRRKNAKFQIHFDLRDLRFYMDQCLCVEKRIKK